MYNNNKYILNIVNLILNSYKLFIYGLGVLLFLFPKFNIWKLNSHYF